MNVEGLRAVVIGGSTGIGSGIGRVLAHRGARVALCDIDLEGADTVSRECQAGVVTTHYCDITSLDSLAAAEASIRAGGDIDLLFVIAGAIRAGRAGSARQRRFVRNCKAMRPMTTATRPAP